MHVYECGSSDSVSLQSFSNESRSDHFLGCTLALNILGFPSTRSMPDAARANRGQVGTKLLEHALRPVFHVR